MHQVLSGFFKSTFFCVNKKYMFRTSLMAQWLRLQLPLQESLQAGSILASELGSLLCSMVKKHFSGTG